MLPPGPDRLALVRIPSKTAAPLAAAARLNEKALLRPEHTPREFLEALLKAGKYREAAQFLAFALPTREAIWWACLSALMTEAGHLQKEDASRLTTAARWILEPDEELRKEAEKLASKETTAGLVARAVAWTGGSVRPPSLPALPPGPDFPNRGVFNAVMKAVNTGPPDKVLERLRQVIALGIHIARGHYLWGSPSAQGVFAPRITGS